MHYEFYKKFVYYHVIFSFSKFFTDVFNFVATFSNKDTKLFRLQTEVKVINLVRSSLISYITCICFIIKENIIL